MLSVIVVLPLCLGTALQALFSSQRMPLSLLMRAGLPFPPLSNPRRFLPLLISPRLSSQTGKLSAFRQNMPHCLGPVAAVTMAVFYQLSAIKTHVGLLVFTATLATPPYWPPRHIGHPAILATRLDAEGAGNQPGACLEI